MTFPGAIAARKIEDNVRLLFAQLRIKTCAAHYANHLVPKLL
jgi:hypothetical protein